MLQEKGNKGLNGDDDPAALQEGSKKNRVLGTEIKRQNVPKPRGF